MQVTTIFPSDSHILSSGFWYEEIPPDEREHTELMSRLQVEKAIRSIRRKAHRATDSGRAERKRERRQRAWRRKVMFVGVDGEGITTPDGGHDYVLLRAGDDYLHTGTRLTSYECLSFLADLDPTPNYVGYYFDYDATMIVKDLPEERLQRLYRNSSTTRSVEWHGFEIHYRPHKYFKVRRVGAKKYVTVSDVGSFFQCSFLKAITAWNIGTSEQREIIADGKLRRSEFITMTDAELDYNKMEIELLEALMSKFAAACRGLDIMPTHWQGPGWLASALLDREGVPVRAELDKVPLDLWEHANDSYFGGRFEVTTFGVLEPPIYNYDINSAYPDALRRLPCLLHGEWTLADSPDSDAICYLAFGTFGPLHDRLGATERTSLSERLESLPRDPVLFGLPVRSGKDGTISWPARGKGWYWSYEIEQAYHQYFRFRSVWNLYRTCDCQPFAFIEPLYKERKRLEALSDNSTGSNMGIALKLILNSLYGKMAQSIGQPKYSNPLYAAMITSMTRAKLYEMVHGISDCTRSAPADWCGKHVHYLATDGMLTTKKLEDRSLLGKLLGEWDESVSDERLLVIQSGLYIGPSKARTRGIPASLLQRYAQDFWTNWYRFLETWENGGKLQYDKVTIPFHHFMGHIQAVTLGRTTDMGTWLELPRSYGFSWHGKRDPVTYVWSERQSLLIGPMKGRTDRQSLPYTKEIGRYRDNKGKWYERRIWFHGQPDYSDVQTMYDDAEHPLIWSEA